MFSNLLQYRVPEVGVGGDKDKPVNNFEYKKHFGLGIPRREGGKLKGRHAGGKNKNSKNTLPGTSEAVASIPL